jgi:hypothetical protein
MEELMKVRTETVKTGGSRVVIMVILLIMSVGCMVLGAILKDLWWGKGFFFMSIILLVPILRIAFSGKEDNGQQDGE